MTAPRPSGRIGGGVFLAILPIVGLLAGIAVGQPSIGLVAGLAAGALIAVLVALTGK